MTAVLLTGMSGGGTSTTLAGLAARGWETLAPDVPGRIEVVDGEPLWREDRIRGPLNVPLAVFGTVADQCVFRGRFDAVVRLTAPSRCCSSAS